LLRFARNDGSGLKLAGALRLMDSAARGVFPRTASVAILDGDPLSAAKSNFVGSSRSAVAIAKP
jgi:hypothetical protein